MIISRTPFRISFLGGGTDYPEYFLKHSGAVLSTAIDKYCYVGLRNGKIWSAFDLPGSSGMGSSSAFTVGLLKTISKSDNRTIAQVATIIERDKLEERVGYQDQYICALGGFRVVKFFPTGITDRVIEADWLSDYLMLFDTRRYRKAGSIVASQLERIGENEEALKKLYEMVYIGEGLLLEKDYKGFGKLLSESWQLKKSLSSKVSDEEIDGIYYKAMKAGALGGKLLGAGGGGFILFVVESDRQEAVRRALRLFHVPFKFDNQGSQVIYDNNH